MTINDDQLKNWFSYHVPTVEQLPQYQMIRDAGYTLAKVIVDIAPASADQAAAVRKVREAAMMANAAIACKGQ